MNCSECERIKHKKNIVYEDQLAAAFLLEKPSTGGHVALVPKEHQPIVEKISDDLFGHLISVANKISIAAFEVLGAHGTNILISNGVAAGQRTAHVMVHIIPRAENDGLNLQWQATKLSEDELKTVQLTIKEALEKPMTEEREEVKEEEIEEIPEEENYLLKQLERTP